MANPESVRHLTGEGCFTDDLQFENSTFGHLLRSPHAHAKLVSINIDAARELPGVVAVYTGADLESAGVGWFCQLGSESRKSSR